MQDRSEIFRRIKQQYFREQLAPLGFQPMDGMILYLLWGGNLPASGGHCGPDRPG